MNRFSFVQLAGSSLFVPIVPEKKFWAMGMDIRRYTLIVCTTHMGMHSERRVVDLDALDAARLVNTDTWRTTGVARNGWEVVNRANRDGKFSFGYAFIPISGGVYKHIRWELQKR